MGFPGEEIVSTAIEKFADGIIKKMDEAEERRNREFALKLKELEFYKGNYDKEIKNIFNKWFDLLQNSLLLGRSDISEDQKRRIQKAVDEIVKPENFFKLKIDTMKYGGTETGKALALFSQISFQKDVDEQKHKYVNTYAICFLLSTLKKEILGQEITPLTILQILINDYTENYEKINECRCYVDDLYAKFFCE